LRPLRLPTLPATLLKAVHGSQRVRRTSAVKRGKKRLFRRRAACQPYSFIPSLTFVALWLYNSLWRSMRRDRLGWSFQTKGPIFISLVVVSVAVLAILAFILIRLYAHSVKEDRETITFGVSLVGAGIATSRLFSAATGVTRNGWRSLPIPSASPSRTSSRLQVSSPKRAHPRRIDRMSCPMLCVFCVESC
jgi:hypothetical protein